VENVQTKLVRRRCFWHFLAYFDQNGPHKTDCNSLIKSRIGLKFVLWPPLDLGNRIPYSVRKLALCQKIRFFKRPPQKFAYFKIFQKRRPRTGIDVGNIWPLLYFSIRPLIKIENCKKPPVSLLIEYTLVKTFFLLQMFGYPLAFETANKIIRIARFLRSYRHFSVGSFSENAKFAYLENRQKKQNDRLLMYSSLVKSVFQKKISLLSCGLICVENRTHF
jgi:hypothetical protein